MFPLLVPLLVFYTARTQAVYYMDDRNTSILYTGATSWVRDPDGGAWDETLTYNYCITSQSCQMHVPFTGSGITLYVAHESDNVNVSITLDGDPSSTTMRKLLNNSTIELYNVSIYDNQSLTFGNHEVTVVLLSWVTGGESSLWFDYAAVNDTKPSASPSSSASTSAPASASASPTPSTSGSTRSHTSIGGIIGGAVGGLVLLGAIITMIFCSRKRRMALGSTPAILDSNSMVRRDATPRPYLYTPSAPDHPSLQHLIHTGPKIPTAFSPQPSSSNQTSSITDTPILAVSPSNNTTSTHPNIRPMRSETAIQDTTSGNAQLTDEQIDFASGLWRANVPATDVARIIERIRVGEAVSGQGSGRGEIISDLPPPRYEHIGG